MPHNASTRNTRPIATVNSKLDKHLAAYVAAASAAGVALLAATPQAEGEVVYTAVHVQINPVSTYQIDLNHDGINDFGLQRQEVFHSTLLTVIGDVTGNQVVRPADGNVSAAALNQGGPVGSHRQFASKTTYGGFFMAIVGGYGTQTAFDGPWANANNKYLGFKFLIDGEVHYGWARLSVTKFYVNLTGYAYETLANQPIPAGKESGTDENAAAGPAELTEPVSLMANLGMLARGADGLDLWRREEAA